MTNPIDDNIPSITPDLDQVEAYKSNKGSQPQKKAPLDENLSTNQTVTVKQKNSIWVTLLMLIIYAAVAAGGWWFYQQGLNTQAQLTASEQRIRDLEQQLSATGEEMGESTVALKVKLEAIIKKTDELWSEMDKLWASAWRRNQAEIKDLNDLVKKLSATNTKLANDLGNQSKSVNELTTKQTDMEFNINAVSEQLTMVNKLKTDLDNLKAQLSTLESKSSKRDANQVEVATTINQLETTLTLLIERVDKLQAKPSPVVQ